MTLGAGTRLGPYEIVAPLGAGGMGEVYKARDTRLDRDVAIKVMAAAVAADPVSGQRLLREARAASALNHPHICTIYDVGDANGRPFIAMEWIEGESLADKLKGLEAGAMGLEDVLRLASQIADGLDAAHSSGIVHRDLKPANIFITKRGDAKILDFGLAKLGAGRAGAAGPAGVDETIAAHPNLTTPGAAVGTVAYMSPEQARGETLTAATDLFSLGIVLYEMTTGRPAFAAATTAMTFDAILNRQPAPPREVKPDVPPALEQIITRLLAKQPSGRHASARVVREELDALRQTLQRTASSGSTRIVPSLAVLPFTNLSPEPENEYIADGITEEIINTLAQIKGLQVAARTSSFAFKGKTPDLADVSAKLHVAHVLTGSVRKAGPKLRITTQLVNAHDGFPIWSERYDRNADDIFAIQDDIATAIAQKLRVALGGSVEEPLAKRATENLAAYELYLKGRFSLGQRGAGLQRALDYFQEALALDSSNARAHEGMSTALLLLGFYGYRPAHEAMPAARRFALNAIDLDSTAADPDGTLMVISWVYDWDWARAERHFNRAIALDPRYANGYVGHAVHIACAHGRFEEAYESARTAVNLDPLSASTLANAASCYLCGGRLDEAETLCCRALELDPLMWNAERFLCTTLLVQGRLDEAIAHAQHALSVSNRNHWLLQISAQILMTAGKQKEATELAKELIDSGQHGYVPCGSLAAGYAILGRIDEAFEWVERAYREREPLPIWRHWPIPFNNDPRMQSIYRRMGL